MSCRICCVCVCWKNGENMWDRKEGRRTMIEYLSRSIVYLTFLFVWAKARLLLVGHSSRIHFWDFRHMWHDMTQWRFHQSFALPFIVLLQNMIITLIIMNYFIGYNPTLMNWHLSKQPCAIYYSHEFLLRTCLRLVVTHRGRKTEINRVYKSKCTIGIERKTF